MTMTQALTSFFLVAVAAGCVLALAPSSGTLRKGMQSAVSILLLLALFSPLYGVDFSALGEAFTDAALPAAAKAEGEKLLDDCTRAGYEEGIARDLAERFAFSHSSVRVTVTQGRATALCAVLRGSDALGDGAGIRRYLEQTYGLPTTIEYERKHTDE